MVSMNVYALQDGAIEYIHRGKNSSRSSRYLWVIRPKRIHQGGETVNIQMGSEAVAPYQVAFNAWGGGQATLICEPGRWTPIATFTSPLVVVFPIYKF